MSQLINFREEKDKFFASHSQSPLTNQQKNSFDGLAYFDENPELRLNVQVEEFQEKAVIEVQTSTGDVQTYTRYGRFEFDVEGKKAALTIFMNDYGFFLPFVDALANKETYGAGRYLEPNYLGGQKFLIDFNLAYNPYCAYNDAWSCPLTPWENRVSVPIKAGEKLFNKSTHA